MSTIISQFNSMFDSFFFHHSVSEPKESATLYGPESHRRFEIIYLAKGEVKYFIEGEEYLAKTGDMIFVPPNEIHSLHINSNTKYERIVVLFDFDLIKSMLAVGEVTVSDACLKPHAYRVIPAEVVKKSRLKEIMYSIAAEAKDGENRALRFFSLVLSLIAELNDLLSDSTHKPIMPITKEPTVKKAIDYVNAHVTEPLTLDLLADGLHLNKFYISHIFSSRLQISFSDFLNGLRIDHACKLMTGNTSITEAAFASGFSSIRTFNRVFARQMGKSPTQYLKDIRK